MHLNEFVQTNPILQGFLRHGISEQYGNPCFGDDGGLIVFDSSRTAVYANGRTAGILGLPEDLPMADVLERINDGTVPKTLKSLCGKPLQPEEYPLAIGLGGRMCIKDVLAFDPVTGSDLCLTVTVIPVLDGDSVMGAIVVLRDIGGRVAGDVGRRALLNELEEERALRRAVFEQMQTAILVVRAPHGDIELESMSLKGYAWPMRLYHRNGTPYRDDEVPVNRVLESGRAVASVEAFIESGDGSLTPVNLSANPVLSPQGDLWAVVMLVRDVSRANRHRQELAEALRSKDKFLSLAAHELKTPLTVLMANVQFLKLAEAGMTPERKSALLDSLVVQCNKVNRLVNDLLDMSRLSTGHLSMVFGAQNPSPLVRNAVEEHAKTVRTHNFVFVDAMEEPCVVDMDGPRVEQVLYNLLSNACRYSPEGSTVKVVIRREGESCVITVEDQGVGISGEDIGKVFDMYFRSEGVKADRPSGLGLGLYVAKQVMQLHHGDVGVESVLGEGTTFRIKLPIKSVQASDERIAR